MKNVTKLLTVMPFWVFAVLLLNGCLIQITSQEANPGIVVAPNSTDQDKDPREGTADSVPVAGCPCENHALAAGVIPTLNDVGACAPMQKTYSGDLVIDENFLRARGNRVVHSIEVKGGLTVNVSDVTVCNFKSDSLQIGDRTGVKYVDNSGSKPQTITKQYFFPVKNVVVQDGEVRSTSAGVLINFKPNSSGLVRRISASGGDADGIRVGPTLPGYQQVVTQSYIYDVGIARDSEAHSDLIQSYPVPYVNSPSDATVVTEKMLSDGFDGTKMQDVSKISTKTGSAFVAGNYNFHSSLISQNYFSSALYNGGKNHAGLAVNAVWMAMTSGAKFEGNLVARVYRGFWIEPERALFGQDIRIVNNRFTGKVDKYMQLSCKETSKNSGEWVNTIPAGLVQHNNVDTYRNETIAALCQN